MIDKGQCPFHREAEGCEIEREEGSKRARTSEEHSDFQRVDKEAPSMQIKCCFHNHSSVPLSEVRFFVIKVKGSCTRGRVRSFAPTNQPANQPSCRTNHHPLTHPTTTRPQTTLLISITKSFGTLLCVMLIKRSLFSFHLVVFFLSIFFFICFYCDRNFRIAQQNWSIIIARFIEILLCYLYILYLYTYDSPHWLYLFWIPLKI